MRDQEENQEEEDQETLVEPSRPPSDVPQWENWNKWGFDAKYDKPLRPIKPDREVLRRFFEIRPTVSNDGMAIMMLSQELHRREETIADIVRRAHLKEEAKKQRREYADKIYGEKIPYAKKIAGLALRALSKYIETHPPESFEDAKTLSKIATDMNTLLRLELGESTHNIEIVHKTNKTVNVILEELRKNDPFVDYPQINERKNLPEST